MTDSKYTFIRVLIIEDNDIDREILKGHLHALGFRSIQEARHGGEAVFKIENAGKVGKPFQLLFTDWRMPKRDGISVLKFVRSERAFKKTKVIMFTSVNDKDHVEEALENGVDDFVLKPIDQVVLKAKLEKIVPKIED